MVDHAPQGWLRRSLGDEVVFQGSSGGATLLFGQGPPRPGPLPEPRAAAILDHLGHRVRMMCWCRQVHGRHVERVSAAGERRVACVGECDGLITVDRGIALAVFTADCVPVLLAGRRVIAAVHAGWRGAAAGIALETVTRCERLYGESPDELAVFLGPAVSAQRYPVGEEVIAALKRHGIDESTWRRGHRVDLRGFLEGQLRSVGVLGVERVGGCTASSPHLASYRRDGAAAGRQISLVFR